MENSVPGKLRVSTHPLYWCSSCKKSAEGKKPCRHKNIEEIGWIQSIDYALEQESCDNSDSTGKVL